MNMKWISRTVVGVMLVLVSTAQGQIKEVLPSLTFMPQSCSLLTADGCSPVLFNDEFGGSELDRDKWDVFEGNPTGGGWLTLSGANIQSKPLFGGGILQGIIQSSDWKPLNQFTDSSFGFEIWTGSNNECHYGIVFKSSGHLAVLRPLPDADGKCSGDPLFQAYPPVSNWDTIRTGNTVSFTLSWCSDSVTLKVSGNGQEGQASYTGQALPNVPLKIRLYAQAAEEYKIDYVRLCAHHAVCLPIVSR